MNDIARIKSECQMLLKLHDKLEEFFGSRKGAVQFFRHKTDDYIFVVQIRQAHLVDIGSVLMALSFIVKNRYRVFQGVDIREQLRMPPGSPDWEYANKHVFLRFEWHPKLQEHIFSSKRLKEGEVYQNFYRIPIIVDDLLSTLQEVAQAG